MTRRRRWRPPGPGTGAAGSAAESAAGSAAGSAATLRATRREPSVNSAVPGCARRGGGYARRMTDPNDDLSSVADPGSMGPDAMTEPNMDDAPDHDAGGGPGVPESIDSPAKQGSPIGPPD